MTLGPLHPWSLGDWVWVKTPTRENLDHQREGPYQVILTTPSALKVAGLKPWIITCTPSQRRSRPGVAIRSQPGPVVDLTLTRGSADEALDRPTDSTNSCNHNK
jgi:hypothetical protein